MNINLNLCGFFGAAIGGVGAFAVLYSMANGDPAAMSGKVRYAIVALVVGALAGNVLWTAVRGPKKESGSGIDPERGSR